MIVVDTNVVFELMRAETAPAVLAWVDRQVPGQLYTTSITVAEIGFGIERLPEGKRRDELAAAAREVFTAFAEQILAFDLRAAARYGSIVAGRERTGTPISGFDAQIAAICQVYNAALASRNGKDFDATGIDVLDPWQDV